MAREEGVTFIGKAPGPILLSVPRRGSPSHCLGSRFQLQNRDKQRLRVRQIQTERQHLIHQDELICKEKYTRPAIRHSLCTFLWYNGPLRRLAEMASGYGHRWTETNLPLILAWGGQN